MKSNLRALAIALGMCFAGVGFAATSVPAATASAATAAAPAAAPAAPAVVAPASTPAAKPAVAAPAAKKATTAMPTVAAAGGGDGKVWVNDKSKTYHCEGTKFYGKTKTGEYMAEADAKAKGNHPVGGKACTK
ncbi:signal protein [Rhodoferax sp. WC2427]|uniref:signal protein n=1 Tax=Rhodoferax sp. WC2427 TaxID=3234144 RepID=UPI0034658C72